MITWHFTGLAAVAFAVGYLTGRRRAGGQPATRVAETPADDPRGSNVLLEGQRVSKGRRRSPAWDRHDTSTDSPTESTAPDDGYPTKEVP